MHFLFFFSPENFLFLCFDQVFFKYLASLDCSHAFQTIVTKSVFRKNKKKKEYWSELPCPPPGNLHHQEVEPSVSCIAGRFFTGESLWKPITNKGQRGKKTNN